MNRNDTNAGIFKIKSCQKTTTLAGRQPSLIGAKVKVFHKWVKLQGQGHEVKKLWYHVKGLVTRNTHVQFESPISSCLKVMAKVKVFQK